MNKANPIKGRITMSNLCSEILQVSEASTYKDDLSYDHVGKDISCNLGSLNIAKTMDSPDFSKSIEMAIRGLTAVSDLSDIGSVPSIARGNAMSHAIGLGQMNLHGYLAREHVHYGSEEALDFTNMYFMTVLFEADQGLVQDRARARRDLRGLRGVEVRLGRVLPQVHRRGVGPHHGQVP